VAVILYHQSPISVENRKVKHLTTAA